LTVSIIDGGLALSALFLILLIEDKIDLPFFFDVIAVVIRALLSDSEMSLLPAGGLFG
jgi:hypothetical protein